MIAVLSRMEVLLEKVTHLSKGLKEMRERAMGCMEEEHLHKEAAYLKTLRQKHAWCIQVIIERPLLLEQRPRGRVIGNEVSMGPGLNRVLQVIIKTGFYYEWREEPLEDSKKARFVI